MVPRGDMCTSLISLSKITSNLPQITHSAKETRQQKEPWGRLGDWGGEFCEQSLNKGGGVHKIGG